jgi:hypothetical protein
MHERSVKAQATIRRRHAEAMLRGLRFVPETPFRVEPFTGGLIRDEQARHVTDYHIVDARGRTIHVVPFDRKQRRTPRLHAERYVQELNAL